MLKIKDNVDLKELEKYGFSFTSKNKVFMSTYKSNDSVFDLNEIFIELDNNRKIMFRLQNYSMYCNSLEELDEDYRTITKDYERFKNIIDKLIKADLVEKVGE